MDVKNLSDEEFKRACQFIDLSFKCGNLSTAQMMSKMSIDNLHRNGVTDETCNRLETYMMTARDQAIRKGVMT